MKTELSPLRRRLAAALSAIAIGAAVAGCSTNPATGGEDVVFMSQADEKRIGDENHPKILHLEYPQWLVSLTNAKKQYRFALLVFHVVFEANGMFLILRPLHLLARPICPPQCRDHKSKEELLYWVALSSIHQK